MQTDIMVSVLCTAYNQERYIRKCLEGFIKQKTKFKFEVLINDDASTDNTASIIREYEQRYPDIIKAFYQPVNLYSQHKPIESDVLFPKAKGKYIALCEGDDYWVDASKLQKQVDAMEKHPECIFCTCRARIIRENGSYTNRFLPSVKIKTGVISSEEFLEISVYDIFQRNGFMVRSSFLKEYYTSIPCFRKVCKVGDVPMRLYFGSSGPSYYYSDVFVNYRIGSSSSISKEFNSSIQSHLNMMDNLNLTYEEFDKYTDGRYHHICKKRILTNEFMKLYWRGEYKRLLSKEYSEVFAHRSIRVRINIILSVLFPKSYQYAKRMLKINK